MPDERYAHAQVRLARFLERDTGRIADDCRTMIFEHGDRVTDATVLLHGLSASPRQLLATARALHERGHNVFVPRLPRHGHRGRYSRALATMDSRQLKACALESLEIARGLGERVHVAGFSLGGLLTCYLAQTQPVYRAVALSPFLGVSWLPGRLRGAVARLALSLPNQLYWWDPILRDRQLPAHGYPQYATHAVAHGLSLAEELFALARTQAPAAEHITLLVNRFDPAINTRAIHKLAALWKQHRPEALEVIHLTRIPIVHDIVEPKRFPEVAERVNRRLVELIDR